MGRRNSTKIDISRPPFFAHFNEQLYKIHCPNLEVQFQSAAIILFLMMAKDLRNLEVGNLYQDQQGELNQVTTEYLVESNLNLPSLRFSHV